MTAAVILNEEEYPAVPLDDERLVAKHGPLLKALVEAGLDPEGEIVDDGDCFRFRPSKFGLWVMHHVSLTSVSDAFHRGEIDLLDWMWFVVEIGYTLTGFETVFKDFLNLKEK